MNVLVLKKLLRESVNGSNRQPANGSGKIPFAFVDTYTKKKAGEALGASGAVGNALTRAGAKKL